MKRKYSIIDISGEPQTIKTGEMGFYDNPKSYVPRGYVIDCVENNPDLVTIYVVLKA